MKKLILSVSVLFLLVSTSKAQFDPANLFAGANISYVKPVGAFSDFAKGGIGYTTLIGYHLDENMGVGLEFNGAITAAIDTSLSSGVLGLNLYGLNSYLAKGFYKFTTGSVRPYGALGLGLARITEPSVSDGNGDIIVKGARRFGLGVNAELGVSLKGVNLSYSFNLGGRTPKEPVFNGSAGNLPIMYHRFSLGYVYNF